MILQARKKIVSHRPQAEISRRVQLDPRKVFAGWFGGRGSREPETFTLHFGEETPADFKQERRTILEMNRDEAEDLHRKLGDMLARHPKETP